MFQTNYERPRKSIRVSLKMAGRGVVEGYLLILQDETVMKALNSPDLFLTFETDLCERQFIAKSAIESMAKVEVTAKSAAVKEEYRLTGRFSSTDPYVVLGVPADSAADVLRQAYHALARDFHTDRLASLGLHPELSAYADEILKRINMAYSIVASSARVAA